MLADLHRMAERRMRDLVEWRLLAALWAVTLLVLLVLGWRVVELERELAARCPPAGEPDAVAIEPPAGAWDGY